MYLAHFGLREAPFSLTPDPRFLYLGERHREGLAHLRYGLEDGGGFVQLTGEIGTGKTTLCRALLAELPGHLDVAFLLNPRVSEVDLLASLCDELRIPYSESDARQKPLVDALYRHLLEAHAGGRTTVLLIDEAQNLSPPVLEQVRLLTNLETTKKKLLQIILIGQPELCEVLARSELRQLAQRITARYHLVPFSRRETFDYIAHRIEVAGGSPRIFSPKARAEVYRQSKGVPRLINVFCDRALLRRLRPGTGQRKHRHGTAGDRRGAGHPRATHRAAGLRSGRGPVRDGGGFVLAVRQPSRRPGSLRRRRCPERHHPPSL